MLEGAVGCFVAARRNGGAIPAGYTAVPLLKITAANINSFVPTGIVVPRTGDFAVECDYVNNVVGSRTYVVVGGVNGSTIEYNGQGMSMRGYAAWRQVFCLTHANSRSLTFSANYPASMSFGIEGEYDFWTANGDKRTVASNGRERSQDGSTFTFGRSGNYNDDYSGTVLGAARIIVAGSLVWDGVPCVRGADGAVGYYDVKGRAFWPANANFEAYYPPS